MDHMREILLGLAEEQIIEYHGTTGEGASRRHSVTTCTGYEISLSDEEVPPLALGAVAGDFNRTSQYIPASALIDDAVSRRWS